MEFSSYFFHITDDPVKVFLVEYIVFTSLAVGFEEVNLLDVIFSNQCTEADGIQNLAVGAITHVGFVGFIQANHIVCAIFGTHSLVDKGHRSTRKILLHGSEEIFFRFQAIDMFGILLGDLPGERSHAGAHIQDHITCFYGIKSFVGVVYKHFSVHSITEPGVESDLAPVKFLRHTVHA